MHWVREAVGVPHRLSPFRRGGPGFTMVELLLVMAIITALAALAIPGFLRSRSNANESAAVGTLHTLIAALENYRAAQTPPTYPPNLAALGEGETPYVDSTLAADPATRQGYEFDYAVRSASEYEVTTSPAVPGVTGIRTFTVDESGVIRADGVPVE